MSRCTVILVLTLFLAGCKPLLPGEKPDKPVSALPSVAVGGSITLPATETAAGYIIVELLGIADAGYYGIELSPAITGEDYQTNHIEAVFYREKECSNVEHVSSIRQLYYNALNDQCWDDVISIDTPRTLYMKIDLSSAFYYKIIDLNLAFTYKGGTIVDPFPNYTAKRELSPGQTLDGVISRFSLSASDYFSIIGTGPGTMYKLSIDYAYNDAIFNPSYTYAPSLSIQTQNICAHYRSADREAVFFSNTGSNPFDVLVYGSTGIRYSITLEIEPKDFTPDIFEPDDGPLASSIETLTDTGNSPILSQTHTWSSGDNDWIKFIPEPSASYNIKLVLEDTWYDSSITQGFTCSLSFAVIKPEGEEIDKSVQFNFLQPPITPQSSPALAWQNTRAQPDPWFFRITPSYYQARGRYSVIIEKM